jgi:glutaredoxin
MSIDAAVALYCQAGCAKCTRVEEWLTRLGVPVVVHDITADAAARAEVERLGFRSLPVVVTSDGRGAGASIPTRSSRRCHNWPRPRGPPRPKGEPDMWSDGPSSWWPVLIVIPLAMIVCVGLMVWMMGGMGRSRHRDAGRPDELADARRILGERLANGDIDPDEYQRRLDILTGRHR